MDIILDFETYCDLPIKEVGAYKYITHESFKPLCMAYCEFDPINMTKGETELITDFSSLSELLSPYNYIWAVNAAFDWQVANTIYYSPLNRWKDVQVVMSKFSLPFGLKEAAKVLETPVQKQPLGPVILKRCCTNSSYNPGPADYTQLYDYCKQDVDTTFEVLKACPSIVISNREWNLWRSTVEMDQRGLPVDVELAKHVKLRTEAFKETLCDDMANLTDGVITKPTQTKRILTWLQKKGLDAKNVTAKTVEELLQRNNLPEDCRHILQARQAANHSSVAKFTKLLDMEVDGKLHNYIKYGATSTQRWAGAGYQVHSLPKATVKDPEALIAKFKNFEEIDNPLESAKALCRSVITAPTGQLIYQGDYSSIEYVLLTWLAGEKEALKRFKEGKSPYIDMASFLYNKPYEAIDKHAIDNLEYFLGKQAVLGCGYQMGAKRFRETCQNYGVEISPKLASFAVKGYRKKYRHITNLWKGLHNIAVYAIENPGSCFTYKSCSFVSKYDKRNVFWLQIKIPSGTSLYYHSPEISQGAYGPEIKHMGQVNYKWSRRFLSPGRITENIIQKLARDIIGTAILNVDKLPNFDLLMTVHDELVALGPEENPEENLRNFLNCITQRDTWAKDVPLKAGGFYARRYKKD